MKKIVVIGPSYPYRGGIAHSINSFVSSLVKEGHKVFLFNFSYQYPNWLYPGKTQFEPNNTNNPLPKSSFLKSYFLLNTINPFSWFLTAFRIITIKPDACFIRYWHPFFIPCFFIVAWILKRKKISVICIVDNLFPHERRFGDFLFVKALFSQVDKVITQSDFVSKQFAQFFPKIPQKTVPLPIYNQFGTRIQQSVAREYLKIVKNKKILLFFGFIRPYKGLDVLLNSMPAVLKSNPDVYLYIVGECFDDFSRYQKIIDKLNINNIIHTYLVYVPNEMVKYWLGACDLLVMPYRSVTNSAINAAGLYYAKKCLLTVGDTYQDLAKKITFNLSHEYPAPDKNITWKEYSKLVVDFI